MVMRVQVAGIIGLQKREYKHEFTVYKTGRGRGARRNKKRGNSPISRNR